MIIAIVKMLLLSLWTALWFLPVLIAKLSKKPVLRDRFICIFSSGMLVILGIRLHVHGRLSEVRPLLLVTNHLSYVDVPILSSQTPARFTPKREIGDWPVIGTICRMTDCVFVDRRPEKVKEVGQGIYGALARGEVVSLFPEATTGDGMRLLPFKSSFFSLAEKLVEGRELTVQPAAITYTRISRLPVDSTQWPSIAWYGDMHLAPHFWEFLKLGHMEVELSFLPPITIKEHGDRKQLAAYCHQQISDEIGIAQARAERQRSK